MYVWDPGDLLEQVALEMVFSGMFSVSNSEVRKGVWARS